MQLGLGSNPALTNSLTQNLMNAQLSKQYPRRLNPLQNSIKFEEEGLFYNSIRT